MKTGHGPSSIRPRRHGRRRVRSRQRPPRPAQAAPVKIRVGWVVVPASTRAAGAGEEGHSQALRPVLRRRGDPLRRHPAGHHRARRRRTRYRAAGVLLLRRSPSRTRIWTTCASICDEIQDGVPGHGTNEFMVLNDGPVKTVADLKGKVLATNAMGSAVDIAMRAMLRRSGLEANKDYTIVEAPFPAMRAMLAEKQGRSRSARCRRSRSIRSARAWRTRCSRRRTRSASPS